MFFVFNYLAKESDGDGYSVNQGDCDDGAGAINPCAIDTCKNSIDQDYSGTDCFCGEEMIDPQANEQCDNQNTIDNDEWTNSFT